MAMSVMHNSAAALSLGELNKNVNKVGKLLGKVSSGMKINSAQDDASSFAISEKMREQIRSLLQDNQNVQNGASLLRTAEGAIDEIVDELRRLKELALNSANDHNSEADRKIIQKEFNQRMANINDIATETNYNGIPLLDGRWEKKDINATPTIKRGGNVVPQSGTGGNTTVSNLISKFSPSFGATLSSKNESATGVPVTSSFRSVNGEWSSSGWKWVDAWNASNPSSTLSVSTPPLDVIGEQFAVNVDFSAANYKGDLSTALNGQGFNILCGTCGQTIGIKFDSSKAPSESHMDRNSILGGTIDIFNYTIGVRGISTIEDLPQAVFDGFKASLPTNKSNDHYVLLTDTHHIAMAKNPDDPTKFLFLKDNSHLQFLSGTITDAGYPEPEPIDESVSRAEHIPNYIFRPLVIHHGTKANENIKVYINDMHTKSLGNVGETLDDVSLLTQKSSNDAIDIIESAIDYALDESTRIGSYIQRLEYTDSNITTMGENVQASESTIRDADMAKEMTEYTKYNILTQSSQAMLAQANQNSSQVLSLLQ